MLAARAEVEGVPDLGAGLRGGDAGRGLQAYPEMVEMVLLAPIPDEAVSIRT